VNLLSIVVKGKGISINLFGYRWIHLLSAIVKEDSVSYQSSIDLRRYGWIRLLSAIDSVSRQSSIDIGGFTYFLQ
jgi:hypothetical protein